jgi:hypothetical protein
MSSNYDFPFRGASAITPHDSNASITGKPIAIYVGVTGNINMTINGADVVFKGATAGSILPLRPTAIKSTSTTATDLVALY